jgi:3-oxoacyl-[acyl-carrier-protein] synthase II
MPKTKRRVAVTGIGIKTPAGANRKEVWEHVHAGRTAAKPIDRFDAASFAAGHAGTVKESVFEGMPPRLLKRMDRFSRLAMSAAEEALNDSGLGLDSVDRETVGVYMGNMYGGWEITDPSLRNLLRVGYQDVSPYVASAWFPTAAQGQITIHWQLKGHSKTVAADTASSALSIGYAMRAIQDGRASVMFCGGAEAPVTPYAYTFCSRSGRLDPDGYRPFDRRSNGYQVGEGAAILVLEELDAARSRGAHIYGEIAGFAVGHSRADGCLSPNGGAALSRVITEALAEAGAASADLDYVGLDAQGTPEADEGEACAVALALGECLAVPACTTAKPSVTHLLGAAAGVEVATGLLAMAHGEVPPVAGLEEPRPGGAQLRLVTGSASAEPVKIALVNARGVDGTHAALVLRAA